MDYIEEYETQGGILKIVTLVCRNQVFILKLNAGKGGEKRLLVSNNKHDETQSRTEVL